MNFNFPFDIMTTKGTLTTTMEYNSKFLSDDILLRQKQKTKHKVN
jgi:hypothetical protein